MNIVISGYYGFDNIGDEAILYSIIQALRKERPDVNITVLSNAPEVTKERYQVDAVNRWKMKEVARAIKASNGLISGGGSLLQDETSLKTIPYYAGIMQIAKFYRKPVFIYAQGMGPFNRPLSRMLVKRALKNTVITVRDNDSKKLLKHIGINAKIELVPDPVMGIDVAEQLSQWFKERQFDKPIVVVSVRDWATEQPYKEKLAASLSAIGQSGYEIVFIPMHGVHDLKTSKEIAQMMTIESHISPHDASIHEKIALIKDAAVLIGIRLHALIFAAVVNTPFLPLSYDPKIDAFANICGQPLVGNIDKEDWRAEDLTTLFTETAGQLEKEKKQLAHAVDEQKRQAQQTARAAIQTFQKQFIK